MTLEMLAELIIGSIPIAFFSSLVTELVKFTVTDRVKKENRALVFNSTAVIAAIVGAIVIAVYLGIEWTSQSVAGMILMIVFGSGLSILGYKSVNTILQRLSPGGAAE